MALWEDIARLEARIEGRRAELIGHVRHALASLDGKLITEEECINLLLCRAHDIIKDEELLERRVDLTNGRMSD